MTGIDYLVPPSPSLGEVQQSSVRAFMNAEEDAVVRA